MIRFTKFFITILLAFIAFGAQSQSTATSSSPYSRYGLGDISSTGIMPQSIAMGGIATAINSGTFFNINSVNPASYAFLKFTVIDVGIYENTLFLSQTGQSTQTNANFRLSHVAFGIPITTNSAMSFGLQPYSQLGYNYVQNLPRGFGTGSSVDTNSTNYLYQGQGGLSKAYFGYGITLLKHLSIGANVSYIFGNLKQTQATEIPDLYGTLNSMAEQDNSIGGLNYDYGAQYVIDVTPQTHLTLGYSASANSKLNSQSTYIVSQYTTTNGVAGTAIDSLIVQPSAKTKVQLPQINHYGVSLTDGEKYLVGMDYTTGKWSNLAIGGVNQGLLDSKTYNIGGQYTPNINAINSYWSTVDYRFGMMYDQSFLNVPNPNGTGNTNIKAYALTFGLGMPLKHVFTASHSAYKINLAVELGQRGTLSNGLVKENYVNFHLGFLLNDKWFQRFKFD